MITDSQYTAIARLRSDIIGKHTRRILEQKLQIARKDYESNEANEARRQLVLAYRHALDVLFYKPMEEL
jgi:hypothetical protein